MRAILAVGLGLTLAGSAPSRADSVPAATLGGVLPAPATLAAPVELAPPTAPPAAPAASLGGVLPAATLGPVTPAAVIRGQEPGVLPKPTPVTPGITPAVPAPIRPIPAPPPGWDAPPPPTTAGGPPPVAFPGGVPVHDAPPEVGPGPDWTDAFAGMGTSGPGGPLSRFWVGAEYLAWWINPGSTPPLLTTAPFLANDPNRFRGALSQGEAPFTTVLAGGNSLFPNEFNGARFTLGYWLDRDQTWGLEGRGFFLGARGNTVTADSMMFPLLARPFYNLNFQTPDAELVARPDLIPVGVASIKTSSQLWGAEANVRRNLITGCNGWLDVIGGFRYLQLDESIRIEERFLRTGTVTGAIPPFTPPYFQSVFDDFRTQNTFYGGQLGLAGEIRRGRWALDGRATVALGATNQRIEINGGQSITQPGQMPHSFTGGLLATPSNIGVFTRERFSVAPEVGLNVGYYLTERLKLAVGYNFLYWSNVVRPGDQIDPAVNVLYVPNVDRPANGSIPFVPAQRPGVPFRESDFWAHGLNVSLQFNW